MRKLVIGLALASTAIATPSLARDNAWYIEGGFGAMIVEDTSFDISGINNAAAVDSDYGYDGGVSIGYDFGPFRLETEGSYRRAENDEYTTGGTTGGAWGHGDVLSFMLNGLLDFGPDDGIQGFVGGGVGVGRVHYRVNVPGSVVVNDKDTRFAWQALAGVRAPVTENIDMGLKYRFHNVDNLSMVSTLGAPIEGRWRSHSLLGTVAYNFGGTEAAPPPP
ncbi:outer membrane beta-barrel protein, partial [Novosphingobium sp. RD2P27]